MPVTTADGAALSLSLTRAMLSRFPLIDGHNDLPWELRERYGSDLSAADLTGRLPNTQTDIPRLVEGGVGDAVDLITERGPLRGLDRGVRYRDRGEQRACERRTRRQG